MEGNIKYLTLLFAYLLGSIPTAFFVGKLKNIDIRKVGSGNVGATNTARILGKRWAALVLAIDVLKGIFTIIISKLVFSETSSHNLYFILFCGLLAVLGHIFPVWLNFKGGKGVATVGGVIIALSPFQAIIALLIFITILFLTKYVSLSSLLGIYSLPFTFFYFLNFSQYSVLFYFFISLVIIITIMHIKNIKRLISGTESKISSFAK
jgi:glycerol-3-phosphate acyltransferase PlsY